VIWDGRVDFEIADEPEAEYPPPPVSGQAGGGCWKGESRRRCVPVSAWRARWLYPGGRLSVRVNARADLEDSHGRRAERQVFSQSAEAACLWVQREKLKQRPGIQSETR
jgi:hypothetical protein